MVNISSPDDLEEWLKNKPQDWGRLLAHRMVLRVVPVLNQAIGSPNLKIDLKSQLTLSVLRIPLSSEVAVYTSNPEIRDALRDIATAALNFHDVSAAGRVVYTAYVAYAIPGIMNASDVARVESAADTVYTLHTKSVARIGSAALNHDVQWLEVNGLEEKHRQKFLGLPLWHGQSNPLETNWQDLKHALQAMDPNWQFWTDWYQAKLDGTLHPGLAKDEQDALYYEIAGYSDELWKEGATAVNEQIVKSLHDIKTPAEVSFLQASYVDGKYLGVSANNKTIDLERKSKPANYKTEQFRTLVNSPEFRSNVERNKTAISFACAGVIVQVEEYKKTVTGSNSLEPELKEQLLVTLDNLTEAVTNIGDNLETDNDVISDKGLEEVATYYSRYCDALSSNFNRYLSAENMGRLTVPVGLILACASVGAGIGVLTPAGGMAGFGVGSLFGKLVTDQAKPKDLIKKIEDNLENQQDCN